MKIVSTATCSDKPEEPPGYDADNNVQSRSTRQGDVISFAYDSLNRLCSKTYAASPVACGGASANYLVTYAYDLDGRLIAANDNSAAVTLPASAARYAAAAAYDPLDRPTNVSWSPAPAQATPAAASVSFDHQYDATNRRVGQTATDSSWWRYPGAGGSSSTGYTANNLNQYTAVGAASPTYDGNGNLQYDGTYHYCYDVESRLTSILSAGNCALPITTVAAYAYDAQGRRKAKTVGAVTTNYVTDADDREVLEYDGASGAIGAWYSFAPAATLGPDAVLNRMDVVANSRQTLIPDIQGSIIGSLDSGGTLSKVGYEVYGENAALTANGYFYTGGRLDPETAGSASQPSGLYHLRARAYSPAWGRFFQTDPLGFAGGSNLYAYVNNDPLNNTDPSGNVALIDNLIGAGVAVTVDLVAQYAQARATNQPFQVNWTRTAIAGGAGFVTSGFSALLGEGVTSLGLGAVSSFALRTTGNALLGAGANVAQTATLNSLQGTNDSLTTAAIAGSGFGALGSALADTVPAISSAINQSEFDQLSPGTQNLYNGIANLSGYQIGGPSPAAVAAGQQVGNFVGSLSSFTGGESSNSSLSLGGASWSGSAK